MSRHFEHIILMEEVLLNFLNTQKIPQSQTQYLHKQEKNCTAMKQEEVPKGCGILSK